MNPSHSLKRYNKLFQKIARTYFDFVSALVINMHCMEDKYTVKTQKNQVPFRMTIETL